MPDIILVRDAIENMVDYMGSAVQDSEQRIIKRIIRESYRELCEVHPWSWLIAECSLYLPSGKTTVTASYTNSSRTVTAGSASFAATDVGKRIEHSGVSYPIVEFVSTTQVKLGENANPGRDIASTAMYLRTDALILPDDFHKMSQVTTTSSRAFSDSFVSPQQWHAIKQSIAGGATSPFRWTILPCTWIPNRWMIVWVGDSGTNNVLTFLYERRPADRLAWSGLEVNANSVLDTNPRIAGSAGSAVITGTATDFTASMVGAWLRIGPTKASSLVEPTGLDGRLPYIEQAKIKSVASTTSLTLETSLAYAATNASFIVSSQLDMPPEHFNVFYALCQRNYAFKSQDEDRIAMAERRYIQALRLAMESDYKYTFHRAVSAGNYSGAIADPRQANFGTYVTPPFG